MSEKGNGGDGGGSRWTEDLRTSVNGSVVNLRMLQDFIPTAMSRYKTYEDAIVSQIRGDLLRAKDHPAATTGIVLAASLVLLRGPRRFLVRNTLGRLQSEEGRFVRAEKSVKDLNLSLDIMKRESRKLLERAELAEKELNNGQSVLMIAGNEIQSLAKVTYKVEVQAAALMDGLREIPSREALKLRAEVASMASQLKQQRLGLDKRILKISELGVPV